MQAMFQERYAAGETIPTGTPSTNNDRILNFEVYNEIPGCVFDPETGYVTLPIGNYWLEGDSTAEQYSGLQTQIKKVDTDKIIATGISAACSLGPTAQSVLLSPVRGRFRSDGSMQIKLSSWLNSELATTTQSLCPITGAAVDIASYLIIFKLDS